MRRVAVLAIKPKYAETIYAGTKSWEFRKVPPPVPGLVLLYESAPVSAITGRVWLSAKIQGLKRIVWAFISGQKMLGFEPGLTEQEFEAYVGKAESVAACFVSSPKRFDKPIPLLNGVRPPQNWADFHVREEEEVSK